MIAGYDLHRRTRVVSRGGNHGTITSWTRCFHSMTWLVFVRLDRDGTIRTYTKEEATS